MGILSKSNLNVLILSRNAKMQGAEQSKCGGSWLATDAVCVESKEGGWRWALEVEMD